MLDLLDDDVLHKIEEKMYASLSEEEKKLLPEFLEENDDDLEKRNPAAIVAGIIRGIVRAGQFFSRIGRGAAKLPGRARNPNVYTRFAPRPIPTLSLTSAQRLATSRIILKYLGKFAKLTLKGAIVGGGFSAAQYGIEEIVASARNTVDGNAHENAPLTDEELADVVSSPDLINIAKENAAKQEKEDKEKMIRLNKILEEQDEMERRSEASERAINETMKKIQNKKDALIENRNRKLKEEECKSNHHTTYLKHTHPIRYRLDENRCEHKFPPIGCCEASYRYSETTRIQNIRQKNAYLMDDSNIERR